MSATWYSWLLSQDTCSLYEFWLYFRSLTCHSASVPICLDLSWHDLFFSYCQIQLRGPSVMIFKHAKGRCQQTSNPFWSTKRRQSDCQEQWDGHNIDWIILNKSEFSTNPHLSGAHHFFKVCNIIEWAHGYPHRENWWNVGSYVNARVSTHWAAFFWIYTLHLSWYAILNFDIRRAVGIPCMWLIVYRSAIEKSLKTCSSQTYDEALRQDGLAY